MFTPDELIRQLKLRPLEQEGGYYAETYRAPLTFPVTPKGEVRCAATAIFYLLTDATRSRLHRLKSDEIWHFYQGDPVDMLQLTPDGRGRTVTLGPDLSAGQSCQVLVPCGVWQGARLRPGGRWALLGCTVAPGFEFVDFELGLREPLLATYPEFRDQIEALT